MSLHRFFVPASNVHGSTITLDDPAQLHHLRDVLRLGPGDAVACFDGQGSEWTGTISQAGATRLVIQVTRHRTEAPGVDIWIAPAMLKADHFEWLIQKVTELGIARLSPLSTTRTIVRLSREQAHARQARWKRIALEAAKQCQRSTIPVIDPVQSLESLLREAQPGALILIPTLAVTAIPLREIVPAKPAGKGVAVLIGPEGDFTPEEVALAERFGARPVSLGPLILRAETAAIAVTAMLQYALHS